MSESETAWTQPVVSIPGKVWTINGTPAVRLWEKLDADQKAIIVRWFDHMTARRHISRYGRWHKHKFWKPVLKVAVEQIDAIAAHLTRMDLDKLQREAAANDAECAVFYYEDCATLPEGTLETLPNILRKVRT